MRGIRGRHEPAVLGVEREPRGAFGHERLELLLGRGVDGEGDVPAGAGVALSSARVGAKLGKDTLAQPQRELEDKVTHGYAP
jgi:hypothetical protein